MNHIDKEIFNQKDISKRINHLSGWYYGCSLLGIVCTVVYLLFPEIPTLLSTLLLLCLSTGDFFFIVTLCYYLFGDRYKAFDKSNNIFLDRTSDYYTAETRPLLEEALTSGSIAALNAVKRSAIGNLTLVRYSNDTNQSVYCQLIDSKGSKEHPLSEVYHLTQQH